MVLVGLALPDARANLAILSPGLIALAVVSLLDDRYGIPVKWRLLVHVWASASLVFAGYAPNPLELPIFALPLPAWITSILTLLFIIWMINL